MRPRSLLSFAPSCLAIALWFGATFYFLGDIGKHNEDYGMVFGDPALGSWNPIGAHPWIRFPYFFRPFLLAHSGAMNTVSWNHVWIGHLELALVHALASWMLMGLLVRLGVRRAIAYAGSLLFTTCPIIAEGSLWTTASCIPFGAVFLLRTLELARRQGAGPSSRLRTLWIGLLAFLTACWYEPAGAALAAVPLVLLAGALRMNVPWRRCVGPALASTVAAGLGCVLYAVLLFATAPSKNRGGTESFVGAAQLLPHTRRYLSEVAGTIVGSRARDLLAGSVEQGWHTLHSVGGWAWIAIVAGLVPLAALAMLRTQAPQSVASPGRMEGAPCSGRGLLALSGLVVFFAAWLPILVVEHQPVDLRSFYIPLVGLTMLGAGLANGVAGMVRRGDDVPRGAVTFLASVAAFSLAAAGAVGLIGFQTQFRLNAQHDRTAVERLRHLVPDPLADTVFVPLRVSPRDMNTGHPAYDRAIRVAKSWPARALVRTAYGRSDISITPTAAWISNPDAEGFRYLRYAGRVEWNRCIPFTVDPGGAVRLVPRLIVAPSGAAPFEIEFPRVPGSDRPSSADAPALRLREVRGGRCVVEDAAVLLPRTGDGPAETEQTPDRMVP